MTTPTGLRSDSTRTPNASRAGALHSHIHSHLQRHGSGPKAPSIGSVVEGRPARRMDGGFAEIVGAS